MILRIDWRIVPSLSVYCTETVDFIISRSALQRDIVTKINGVICKLYTLTPLGTFCDQEKIVEQNL